MHCLKSQGLTLQLAIGSSEVKAQYREPQPYCTCGKCIARYILLWMKWFLMRKLNRSNTILKSYALIFEDLLPRSLDVFEGTKTEDRASEVDFLDLDIYSNLDQMLIALRRMMTGSF